MDVFLVFREGVYRHELCGSFSDHDSAVSCADRFAAADNDDYHSYCVFRTQIDSEAAQEGSAYRSPFLEEPTSLLYSVKRSGALKKAEQ